MTENGALGIPHKEEAINRLKFHNDPVAMSKNDNSQWCLSGTADETDSYIHTR